MHGRCPGDGRTAPDLILACLHAKCTHGLPLHLSHSPTSCRYFERLFPELLLACFSFGLEHCSQDASLKAYFPDGLCAYPFAADIMTFRTVPERDWVTVSSEPLKACPPKPGRLDPVHAKPRLVLPRPALSCQSLPCAVHYGWE